MIPISIFPMIVSIVISMIGSIYIYLNWENYGTLLNVSLNILLYLSLGVIFSILYVLSAHTDLNMNIALLIWKISIIFWMISISILSLVQVAAIKFENLTPLPSIFYALIGGFIISQLFLSSSIVIFEGNDFHYSYVFKNPLLLFSLITYNIIIVSTLWYNLSSNFSSFRDKQIGKNLGFLTIHFTLIIFIYSLHLIFQNIIFRYLYLIVYLIGSFIATYNIFKRPTLFFELTNKIFDFIIFHKSGILLFSYNFETGKETDESLLKGSILIGINHILSNFTNKKDQLNLIKMKERDIVFEYDNTHGYAILLTTNHRNNFIEKAVRSFMDKFTKMNEEKLKNMKGLIDISEFKNAKELILANFDPYILKDSKTMN
ncbi:hypothetical protein LCGC14_1019210 [marine sediment metagenome]|uniref:Uncharacterized protein n=1 Tax=marine sediment metagenome TaxID=412755 RepID=A0A0F9R3W0_9ZZZZ